MEENQKSFNVGGKVICKKPYDETWQEATITGISTDKQYVDLRMGPFGLLSRHKVHVAYIKDRK